MEVHDPSHNPIQITREVIHSIGKHMTTCLPEEACGILLGSSSEYSLLLDDYIPVRNTASEPRHRFSLEPAAWTSLLLSEPRICGLFHSHPADPPVPSQDDIRQLQAFGSLFKVYFIGTPFMSNPGGILLHAYEIIQETIPLKLSEPYEMKNHWSLSQADYALLSTT